MPTTFRMRAYDPTGDEYVYWDAEEEFDEFGTQYSGSTPFGSLEGVTCILTIFQTRTDLFVAPFLPTQDRDETTPDHEGTNFDSLSAQVVTAFPPFFTTQDRDESVPDHEGTCFVPLMQVPVEDDITAVPPWYPTQDLAEPTPDHEGFSPDSLQSSVDVTAPPYFDSSGVCVNEFYFPGGEGELPAVPEPMVAETSVAEFKASRTFVGTPEEMVATTSVAEFKANNTGPSAPLLDPIVATTSVEEFDAPVTKPADGADELIVVTSVAEFAATLDPITYPDDISGLIGWWDASDTATMDKSGGGAPTPGNPEKIEEIRDKSGFGNHFQATAGSREPGWASTVVQGAIKEGKGTLIFSGTSDKWMRSNPVSPEYDVVEKTVIGIIDGAGTTGTWWHYLSQQTNGEGAQFVRVNFGAQDAAGHRKSNGADTITSKPINAGPHWVSAKWIVSGGFHNFRVDNKNGVSTIAQRTPVTTGPSDYMTLGCGVQYPSYAVDAQFTGKVGEFMVYDRILTLQEVQDLARYFAHFWGVTQ